MYNEHLRFNSVAQYCLILCNPIDCSMPGFPVYHQLPELAQTLVHQVSDAIWPSHPLSRAPQRWEGLFHYKDQFFSLSSDSSSISSLMNKCFFTAVYRVMVTCFLLCKCLAGLCIFNKLCIKYQYVVLICNTLFYVLADETVLGNFCLSPKIKPSISLKQNSCFSS